MQARYSASRVFRLKRVFWATLLSFITAGLLIPLSASAQVVVTGQRISTTLNPAPECTVNTCLEVQATGSDQQQLCMVTVLDGSTSMVDAATEVDGLNRWERTKLALEEIVLGIGNGGADPTPHNVFSLVVFGSAVTTPIALTSDTSSFNTTLRGLDPPAGTNYTWTEEGINVGDNAVCPQGSFRLILLASDGVPTRFGSTAASQCDTSPTVANTCTDQAIAAGATAKAAGWHIVTVGLGLDPLDATEALGISVLDDIATNSVFNIPTPADASAVVTALITVLGDITASNIVVADTLTDCWSYVTSSTTGYTTLDPVTQNAPDGRQVVPYSIPTLGTGETRTVCFDMEYDVATCGNVPATVAFNSGNVTYDTSEGSDQTDDIPGSTNVDMTSCLSILPVELVDFTAITEEQTVTLHWSTASELNNAGFEVEHALADGYFEMKGFVEGHGSTNSPKNYSFTVRDLEPGSHLFRLKQVDYDGAFEYSPVVEVAVEVPDQYFLSEVYPNPFNPQAAVRFWVTRSQHVEVALHDIQGRQLKTLYEGVPASKASTLVRIDGSGLSSGTYLVRIQGEDFKDSRQVTLLK